MFVFPGLGLGALAVRARRVTNHMIQAASKTLASQITDDELAAGLLFPSVSRLRAVSIAVAIAVARQAVRDGVASLDEDAVERAVASDDVGAGLPVASSPPDFLVRAGVQTGDSR